VSRPPLNRPILNRRLNGLEHLVFDGEHVPIVQFPVTTDIRGLGEQDGTEFCRTLPERAGVVAIPSAVFYDHKEGARSHVRFAFCKRPEVLTEALDRLSRLSR
jgi:N-succinyldiaminopimelate aminotransferase